MALLLPILLGIVGLVIDAGLMMAAQRQAQNAADSAAVAAAWELVRLRDAPNETPTPDPQGAATAAVHNHNDLPDAEVQTTVPPYSGAHSSSIGYVEVHVSAPVRTMLMHLFGFTNGTVTARAVAGYEYEPPDYDRNGVADNATLIALDRRAAPGFQITGNASLRVQGGVHINSEASGQDEWGTPIDDSAGNYAGEISGNSFQLDTPAVRVVGGVRDPDKFPNLDAGASAITDPYADVPAPSDTVAGSVVRDRTTNTYTYSPGVFDDTIRHTGQETVVFRPGIYILRGGMEIGGGVDVSGEGVMFYMTGTGSLNLTGNGQKTLTPPVTGTYAGMLFFQDRNNTSEMFLRGTQDTLPPGGIIYAPSAKFTLHGDGTLATNYQMVVASFELRGSAQVTLNGPGSGPIVPPATRGPFIKQVYLVE